MELRRMRWMRNVKGMGEKRNMYETTRKIKMYF
jgi:hypothetical protein